MDNSPIFAPASVKRFRLFEKAIRFYATIAGLLTFLTLLQNIYHQKKQVRDAEKDSYLLYLDERMPDRYGTTS